MTPFNVLAAKPWPPFGWPGVSTSVSALFAYRAGSFTPNLVFDFINNLFATGGDVSTFGASITHAASSNATMVDSDGLLKWRPHNLITKSNTFDTWNERFSTITANNATGPDGVANTADTITFNATASQVYNLALSPFSAGDKLTIALWVRSDTLTTLQVSFNGRANADNNTLGGTVAVTSTWALVSVEVTVAGNDNGLYYVLGYNSFINPATAGTFEAYGAHMFRSDLGGMVNNPDTTSSYVPTTSAAVYLSRRGHHIYNGSAWVNEGILHESKARTNLLTYSNDFTNAAWLRVRAVVSANSTTSPSGATDADLVTPQSGGWAGVTFPSASITSGTTYTGSIYAKANGYNWLQIGGSSPRFAATFANVNLSDGSLGNSNIDVIVTPAGNGWYRIAITAVATQTTSSAPFFVAVYNTDVASRLPDSPNDGTSGIYLYGTQFELGSTPSSYIPTTTASVTRAAETLTVPAANLPYDSTNVSIQIDGKMTYADTGIVSEVQPYLWELSPGSYISSRVSTVSTRTGQISFNQRAPNSGTDGVPGASNTYSPGTNVPFNIAARHGSTFLNGAHEGTLLTANTTPTILPDLSSTDLLLCDTFMGTIGQFRMWDEDLTDAGLVAATLPSTEPSLSLTFDGSENSFIVLDWSE